MEIYYQGTDITDVAQVRACTVRDTCGAKCDGLEISLEDAESWMRWQPQTDDEIRVALDGYNSGTMYVNTVWPEDGEYTILASALPCVARRREYRTYAGKTVEAIVRECANNSNMGYALYGGDGNTVIPYIRQENESAAAFLDRLAAAEGAKLKCAERMYWLIDILTAQATPAVRLIELTAESRGAVYTHSGRRLKTLTVISALATGNATDSAAEEHSQNLTIYGAPVSGNALQAQVQAGRTARALLLQQNRESETLKLETVFDPALTAMARIDITGGTDADGEWIVDTAEHDLVNKTSKTRLVRCIRTII